LPFFGLRHDPAIFSATLEGRRPERIDSIPDAAWDIMVDCWKHSPEERPQTSKLVERLESFVDPAEYFQVSDYWLDSTSKRRAIRQPSPLIPSSDEMEKFWEGIKSSSNSLLRSERKKRDRELDDDTDDSSQAFEGLSSGGVTSQKWQRIVVTRPTLPLKVGLVTRLSGLKNSGLSLT
jgi:hypothetical protein